jgi:hypothetical protein
VRLWPKPKGDDLPNISTPSSVDTRTSKRGMFARKTEEEKPAEEVVLAIFGKSGTRWFDVHADGLTVRQAGPKAGAKIIRWAGTDRRVVQGSTSRSAIERQFRRTSGEDYAVINATRDVGVAYGCPEREVFDKNNQVVPIGLLLDVISAGQSESRSNPRVAWLRLKLVEGSGKSDLVVGLFGFSERGEMFWSDPAVDPSNEATAKRNAIGSVVAADKVQLAGLSGIDKSSNLAGYETKLFELATVVDTAALLGALRSSGTQTYPREPMVAGLPASVAMRSAFATSLAFFVGTAGYIGVNAWQLRALKADGRQMTAKANATARVLNEEIGKRATAMAASVSLRPDELIGSSIAVWSAGTTVTLDATYASRTLHVHVPLVRSGNRPAGADRRALFLPVDEAQLALWTSKPAPQGYRHLGRATKGDFDGIVVTYAAGPVDADLLQLVGGSPGVFSPVAQSSGAAGSTSVAAGQR